jgi:carboxypeptidase C (cathepsin A)
MMSATRRVIIASLTLGALAGRAAAQSSTNAPSRSAAPPADPARLPPDQTTRHTLELPDRTLHVAATAGAIRLSNDDNVAQADVAFMAYQLEGADPRTRPVSFVFNGGPGMASGWLQVGAIGPWRIPIGGSAGIPSGSPEPLPNAETWLDFTDLVFIDPPGTGYSRIVASGEDTRRHFWSVTGDVEAMAEVIRRWLDRNGRAVSPKHIVGESYSGIRAPRLARMLEENQGVGLSGLVLVSPFLDAHNASGYNDPFSWADRLPSEVAAARALKGPVSRGDLADVEQYAAGEYLTDLVRGTRDPAAVARITEHVAALTGLDPATVRRYQGRIDAAVFLHELERGQGRVASEYDATKSSTDPFPHRALSEYADPVLDGLRAPVSSAMVAIYTEKLNWRPDGLYRLVNDATARQWDWGRGMGRPESLSALQAALALDPKLQVLVAHGLYDLVTPYFTTVRMLNALPDQGSAERMRLAVYPGGHMFYSVDASRAAFREAARPLFV